jgi:hypothetical protein
MRWLTLILLLAGCADIDMPTPISLPSICMGEKNCEARKNAETLANMGFPDVGLRILCDNTDIGSVLELECELDTSQYP